MSKRLYSLTLLSIILSALNTFAGSVSPNGSWDGRLKVGDNMGFRVVININGYENDAAEITMDAPDHGAYGIPMHVNFISLDSLSVSLPEYRFQYKGRIERDSIQGQFYQGYLRLPLTLRRKIESLNRPQTPKEPFPYLTQEISFQSALDGASLYGTLSTPGDYTDETPVVILISGSGTQNRDEEIFEHKPFAVIADYLARNGIASLRYDDRGFDKTTGLAPNATTYENAMDAKGGIKFLKDKGFSKIGVIGHSEGGLIADILASEALPIDFIIEIGGPAVAGDEILIYQNEFLLRDGGMPEEYISMYTDAMRGIFKSQKDVNPEPFEEDKYVLFSPENKDNPVLAPLEKNLKDNLLSLPSWLRYFINYDPLLDIRNIKVPVFMLYGENDTQVPPSINLPVLKNNVPDVQVKLYPALNHLMQHSKTGKVAEYVDIEETISPEVLEDIAAFIRVSTSK